MKWNSFESDDFGGTHLYSRYEEICTAALTSLSPRRSYEIKRYQNHGSALKYDVDTCPLRSLSIEEYNSDLAVDSSIYGESSLDNHPRCCCLSHELNKNRIEAIRCETLAKRRNRQYSSKVTFRDENALAPRLYSDLRLLAGIGSLQNCMGRRNDELKRDKFVAIPMKKENRSERLTLFDEVKDAIVNGITHHCLQVVLIHDRLHHVKRLMPKSDVAGVLWVGPTLPRGSQVIFGVYVGEARRSCEVTGEREAYAIEVSWKDPHRRFIRDKEERRKVSYHPLWKKQMEGEVLTSEEYDQNLDEEIGFSLDRKRLVLPPPGYLTIDAFEYFNEIVMMNDSRIISCDRRLRSNAKFYQVYYEGWPYYIVAKEPSTHISHGDEILINCGAAYRFGHLVPMVKQILLERIYSKSSAYGSFSSCSNGWIKRHLPFETMTMMINSIPDVIWESDEDLPDKPDSESSSISSICDASSTTSKAATLKFDYF